MTSESKIVNRLNKHSVFELIRHAAEGISRADIARNLGVSRSTVSAIVDALIAAGLVMERGAGVSRGGRRPIVLQMRPDAGWVVGVDVGATHALVLVTLAAVDVPLCFYAGEFCTLRKIHYSPYPDFRLS